MFKYHVLRAVTRSIRAVEVAALKAKDALSFSANNTGALAKTAALDALDRIDGKAWAKVDAAFDALYAAKERLEVEQQEFIEACASNYATAERIFNEVL